MMQEMYEWYMSLEDEDESLPRRLVDLVREELPKLTSGSTGTMPVYMSPEGYLDWTFDRTRYSGASKWDRIGKPFVEGMVGFNAKLHFVIGLPSGPVLRKMSAYMLANPDWDEQLPDIITDY
ncbi:MAG: hypothetical protein [Circular genetic element sp.]|nr:MAG: hypothetical protein [Circular genetic element sp.]